MTVFKTGDWVRAADRYYGEILSIIDDIVLVNHIGPCDCCLPFSIHELKHADTPPVNYRYSFHIGDSDDIDD